MGYKFHKSSVTGFYCPGISTFDDYLTAVGISADSNGLLDTDDFINANLAPSTITSQYVDYYIDAVHSSTTGLYKGILASGYSGSPTMGYIQIPYKINGSNSTLQMVLPGTTPHMRLLHTLWAGDSDSAIAKLERTPTQLKLTNRDTGATIATWSKAYFPDKVIPLFVMCTCQAGGGGGSSSGLNSSGSAGIYTTSGGGGGSGAVGWGIINLVTHPVIGIVAGKGGTAAAKSPGSEGGPSLLYDFNGSTYFCDASGGGRGIGTAGGSGGAISTDWDVEVYQSTSATSSTWNTFGGGGGWDGSAGGNAGNPGRAPGGNLYIRTTPFVWPPSTNDSNSYLHPTQKNYGSKSGAGGGAGSWYGDGGNAATNSAGGAGGTGAGGAGGEFKTGTWLSGGRGGKGFVSFYY